MAYPTPADWTDWKDCRLSLVARSSSDVRCPSSRALFSLSSSETLAFNPEALGVIGATFSGRAGDEVREAMSTEVRREPGDEKLVVVDMRGAR